MTGGVRRLLSTDIDGTIVFDRAISPADAAAMRRWREAGNLLVMNTGRSISALRSALDGFDVDYDYAVLYTGAVLTDGRAGIIEARTLPDGLIEEVLDVLGREERITIFATTLAGDLQLHDTLGSSTDLLTLFRRGTTADLAGRAVVGIPLHLKTAAATDRIEAEVARKERDKAAQLANTIPAAEAEKQQRIIAAEALMEQQRREGLGEGERIKNEMLGRAEGFASARGGVSSISGCRSDPDRGRWPNRPRHA